MAILKGMRMLVWKTRPVFNLLSYIFPILYWAKDFKINADQVLTCRRGRSAGHKAVGINAKVLLIPT